MGKISSKLRRAEGGRISYWCQGCKKHHVITVEGPHAWGWNGNVEKPTFTPSVLAQGHSIVTDEKGEWTGEYHRDAAGEPIELRCHTFITDGMVQFLQDCSHELAGQTLPLPDLPVWTLEGDC